LTSGAMSKVRICPLSYSGTRSYRIIMFAELVGRENVIAGTDCSRVPSANRLGQAPRPVRRRGDREQEVVELNSRVPVQDERNKKQKSLEVKVRPLLSSPRRQNPKENLTRRNGSRCCHHGSSVRP
jgi:hypothetical protein